jgi:hypothetical protein
VVAASPRGHIGSQARIRGVTATNRGSLERREQRECQLVDAKDDRVARAHRYAAHEDPATPPQDVGRVAASRSASSGRMGQRRISRRVGIGQLPVREARARGTQLVAGRQDRHDGWATHRQLAAT